MPTDANERGRTHVTALLLLGVLVALAGCGGLVGGPSVSDAHADTSDDGYPVLVFNYSVSDYSDVILEGPDGDIVTRGTLNPDKDRAALAMQNPRSGEYTIVIQQGGETQLEKPVSFSGPDARVVETRAQWSGNSVEEVGVTVENRGDVPIRVINATATARGAEIAESAYTWIPAGESETVTITSSFDGITVQEEGGIDGDVTVRTNHGRLSGQFSKTFEGPRLEIAEVRPVWDGPTLMSATVVVRNAGDLPTTSTTSLRADGTELASSYSREIPPGETDTYTAELPSGLAQVQSGGTAEINVLVDSPSGSAEETISKTFEGPDFSITSSDATAYQPYNEQLYQFSEFQMNVRNDGDTVAAFDTVRLSVNGKTATGSFALTQTIDPAGSDTVYTYIDISIQGGTHTVEVEFLRDGEAVGTATTTILIG